MQVTNINTAVPPPGSNSLLTELDPDVHFQVSHLQANLQQHSVRGGLVTFSGQTVKFAVQLAGLILLARILDPFDFGLMSMVAAVTGFVGLFRDFGLSAAVVQRPEINHQQVSTLFWITVGASIAMMLLLLALAPVIAWFYGEPRLIEITSAMSITFLVTGLSIQHQAVLRRQMRFVVLTVIDTLSLVASVLLAVVLALSGAAYWSLVGQAIVYPCASAAAAWLVTKWRPGLPRRNCGIRSMASMGGKITAIQILEYWSRNFDNLIIGRYWGAAPLGIYARAYQLMMLPLGQITAPIWSVAVPTLSRLQNDPEGFRRYYYGLTNTIMWISGPVVALLGACSEEVISIALGSDWLAASGVFRILALAAFFQPLYSTLNWVLLSLDRAGRALRWAVFSNFMFITSFLVGLPFGIQGVAAAFVITFLLCVFPCSIPFAFRDTSLGVNELLKSVTCPILLSAAIFIAATSGLHISSGFSALARFAICVVLCAAVTGLLVVLVPAFQREVRLLLQSLRSIRAGFHST